MYVIFYSCSLQTCEYPKNILLHFLTIVSDKAMISECSVALIAFVIVIQICIPS